MDYCLGSFLPQDTLFQKTYAVPKNTKGAKNFLLAPFAEEKASAPFKREDGRTLPQLASLLPPSFSASLPGPSGISLPPEKMKSRSNLSVQIITLGAFNFTPSRCSK